MDIKKYIFYANRQIKSAGAGSIVAVVGFRDSVTGDTLLHNKSFAEGLKDSAALPGVAVPDPVSLSETNLNYCSLLGKSLSFSSRKSKIFS